MADKGCQGCQYLPLMLLHALCGLLQCLTALLAFLCCSLLSLQLCLGFLRQSDDGGLGATVSSSGDVKQEGGEAKGWLLRSRMRGALLFQKAA